MTDLIKEQALKGVLPSFELNQQTIAMFDNAPTHTVSNVSSTTSLVISTRQLKVHKLKGHDTERPSAKKGMQKSMSDKSLESVLMSS